MALLTEHEQRKVAEAIARVERDTDAELVTVLAARADDYAYIPLLWASLLALLVPGIVHYLTGWLTMRSLLLVQWGLFIVLCLLFRLPKVTTHLIPRACGTGARRIWRGDSFSNRTCTTPSAARDADLCLRGRTLCGDSGGRRDFPAAGQQELGRDCCRVHRAGAAGAYA
jgi:hypothetical protein